MYALGHITDQELAEISAQPVAVAPGADPPNGCIDAAIGGFFCAYCCSYLTGTLGLTDERDQERRPDHPDDAAARHAGRRRPGRAEHAADGRPARRHVHRRGARHRPCAGHERQPPVRLRATPTASRSSSTPWPARAPGRPTRSSSPPRRSRGIGARPRSPRRRPLHVAGLQENAAARDRNGPSPVHRRERRQLPRDARPVGALIRSSNTYFLALEDALGSVEEPVRMAAGDGHALRPAQPVSRADEIIARELRVVHPRAEATSPLDLANAYATLAPSGTQCDPDAGHPGPRPERPAADDADGQPLVTDDNCTPEAIPPGVATTLNQILVGDVSSPAARARGPRPGHQIAGKTGTVQDTRLGRLRRLHAAVRGQRDGPGPEGGQDVGGFGGDKPATIWHDAMAPILTAQAAGPSRRADPACSRRSAGAAAPQPAPPPAPGADGPPPAPRSATGGDRRRRREPAAATRRRRRERRWRRREPR